ncbi:Cyclic AMP receptor protein [Anaerolineales bacterium]|nr:Cyclic AMP receptor protein [Anaerolineales bacterium]
MKRSISNLLSIAPGEEQKTSLLYLLHLIFYLGLMWGDAARETLFLSAWSADDLAFVFVIYAIIGFLMGIAYTFVADRISNGSLLKIIMGIMILWLVSVRIMLETNGGPRGTVYPYFYLVYSAFRDVSTMHILLYINDFYDTRASKRALPLMLSAGIAGGTLAGFTTNLLNQWVGLNNTPLAWAVALAICFLVVLVIERRLTGEIEQIERQRKKAISSSGNRAKKSGGLQNLVEGFQFVRQSGLLRGLAVATLVMVVLMNLLIYQSSREFASQFANNPDGLFNFYGILNGISNVGGLLVQSLFLSRLVNMFGVGSMNLFFPIVTLGAVALINLVPSLGSAIFARLDHSAIKQTFRNPLDAMLYNSVPLNSKTRARGFIGGFVVPLGTLTSGLILLVMKSQLLTAPVVITIGIGLALLYVLIMFNVRRDYGRSMTSLLAGDEIVVFNQDQSEALPPDPATVVWLREKLQSLPLDSASDGQAVFVSQILYDMDSRFALPVILDMVGKRGPFFKKGAIELLDQSNLNQANFVELCERGLDDSEPMVREAAAGALLNFVRRDAGGSPEKIASILNSLYARLDELELEEQTQLLILLFQHGSLEQQSNAQSILNQWLESTVKSGGLQDEDAHTLSSGLIVLVEVERLRLQSLHGSGFENNPAMRRKVNEEPSRLKDMAMDLLKHPLPQIRQQLTPALVHQCKYIHWDEEHWAVQSLVKLLEDPEETIRLAVMEELQAEVMTIPLKPVVWQTLNDPMLSVRRLACKLPIHLKFAEMQALRGCLDVDSMQSSPYRAESAIYLLIQAGQRGMRTALGKAAESLVRDTYWLTLEGSVLRELAAEEKPPRPGARLMFKAFQEASLSVIERIFWLMSADSSEEEVQAVRRALPSTDPAERANAAEALESILPPVVARQLAKLLDGSPAEQVIKCAEDELDLHPPSLVQVVHNTWTQINAPNTPQVIPSRLQYFYADGWLTTAAIYLMTEVEPSTLDIDAQSLREALMLTLEADTRPNVRDAAKLVLSKLDSNPKETVMSSSQPLSLVEKVIFLKEVPFFADLSLQEISILAGISEEVSYPAEHKIFSQGDNTKSLYLIIRGKVSVQQSARAGSIVRLRTLEAKSYFAETSLFDGAPHQADIVTIDPVDILLIRQSTLFALIRRRPDLGLSLLKALSQRLRETYAQIAQTERAKPQKLMSLYDKMEK